MRPLRLRFWASSIATATVAGPAIADNCLTVRLLSMGSMAINITFFRGFTALFGGFKGPIAALLEPVFKVLTAAAAAASFLRF